MSRVAQLDSQELQNELHNLMWADYQFQMQPQKHKEEIKFLLDSLVFYFGATYLTRSSATTTYTSHLSGVSFNCRKRTLFLVTILANYIHTKLSHCIFNSGKKWALRLYTITSHFYAYLDLLNMAHFLMSGTTGSFTYLSPLHKFFRVASTTDTYDPKHFYQNTVYAGIEFQNRQLLWNAILELFNTTLFTNTTWLIAPPKKSHKKKADKNSCVHCGEFPTNPYKITCCQSVYCYVCVVTILQTSHCEQCDTKNNLKASPIY